MEGGSGAPVRQLASAMLILRERALFSRHHPCWLFQAVMFIWRGEGRSRDLARHHTCSFLGAMFCTARAGAACDVYKRCIPHGASHRLAYKRGRVIDGDGDPCFLYRLRRPFTTAAPCGRKAVCGLAAVAVASACARVYLRRLAEIVPAPPRVLRLTYHTVSTFWPVPPEHDPAGVSRRRATGPPQNPVARGQWMGPGVARSSRWRLLLPL